LINLSANITICQHLGKNRPTQGTAFRVNNVTLRLSGEPSRTSHRTQETLWKETQQTAETYLISAEKHQSHGEAAGKTASTPTTRTNYRPSRQTRHAVVHYTHEAFPLSPCSLSPSLLRLPYSLSLFLMKFTSLPPG